MKRNIVGKSLLSATSRASQGEYTTTFERFKTATESYSTGLSQAKAAYSFFMTDRGEVTGSPSVTSRQEAYRTLNAGIYAKVVRR